ncbi:hypothetical protein RDI58_026011 [Solanum bulbocastanum]|uniref:Uncharacterized protein n=1 Tax=Solanum bulbocastanum TaxID=147425 RepID=A0AAN8ST20_SOLBU
MPNLKYLDLSYCRNLESVHYSLGYSKELIELNLYNCGRLKRFPCVNVESLIYMDLEFCSSLEKFPKIFGKMKPELKIKTGLSGIRELPSSFGFLLYKDEPELESLLQTEHCIGTKRSRYDNSEHRDEASGSSSKKQRSHSDIRRGVIFSSETLQHIPRQWRKPEYEMKLREIGSKMKQSKMQHNVRWWGKLE